MTTDYVKHLISDVEKKRGIKLPICFLNTKGVAALNEALDSGNPLKVRRFYQNFSEHYDISSLKNVEQELKKRRKVSPTDKNLIAELTSIKKRDTGLFFEVSGNLYYISHLLDEMKKVKRMKKVIRVSLLLWIYLNVVEIINKYVADFLYARLRKDGLLQEKKFKQFVSKMRKKPPQVELGTTIEALKNAGFITNESDSIFASNKFVRNKLSHANMFYDFQQKTIFVSTGDEYPLNEFRRDIKKLLYFLNEMIFQLNNNSSDLMVLIDDLLNKISGLFLRIGRSGILRKQFSTVICKWRSEKK